MGSRLARTRAAFALAGLGASLLAATTGWAQELNGEVQRLIAKAKLSAEQAGVFVAEMGESQGQDTLLAGVSTRSKFIPASNQKLFSTGAALVVLGGDYAFRTELILAGDKLILKGAGDPALGDPEILAKADGKLTIPQFLQTLAAAVKQAGVESISEVVADDRVFDRVTRHPLWPARHEKEAYCPEITGLNFHANLLWVFPKPDKRDGQPPSIMLQPACSFIEIDNQARSSSRGSNAISVERIGEGTKFRVKGECAVAAAAPVEVAFSSTPLVFAKAMAEALTEQGIKVGKPGTRATDAVRLAGGDEKFDQSEVIGVVSTPLADVVKRCNTVSQNMYAEALLKAVGHHVTNEPGSWENGAAVVRMTLSERLGAEAAGATVIIDGSGLCEQNRVSPETLAHWMESIARDPKVGSIFVDSLATTTEGSVKARFRGTPLKCTLQAKTGHVNGVSCLSGFLTHPKTGRRVVFSILTNFGPTNEKLAGSMDLQRDIVRAADAWLAKQTTAVEARVPETSGR